MVDEDVLDDLAAVVGSTRGHEGAPTPCADLDVAGVRHHAASWLANFADGYEDPAGQAAEAGAEVRDAAPALDRLLGLSGRDPRCRPGDE